MFRIKPTFNNIPTTHLFGPNDAVNPKREWILLVILFSCMVAASFVFDAYLYHQIVSGDMYISVNKNELVLENLKTDEIKKLLANFELKAEKLKNLRIEKLIDPSL